MNKTLGDAVDVLGSWLRLLLTVLETTVLLPFRFVGALFD